MTFIDQYRQNVGIPTEIHLSTGYQPQTQRMINLTSSHVQPGKVLKTA